jgi:hypothetical protein
VRFLLADVLDGIVTALLKSETTGNNGVTIQRYDANRVSPAQAGSGVTWINRAIGKLSEFGRSRYAVRNLRPGTQCYTVIFDAKRMAMPIQTGRTRPGPAMTIGGEPAEAIIVGRQCGFYHQGNTRYQPWYCTSRRSAWNASRGTCMGGPQ